MSRRRTAREAVHILRGFRGHHTELCRREVAMGGMNSGANHPSRLSRPFIRPLIILAITSSRSLRAIDAGSDKTATAGRSLGGAQTPEPGRARL